MSICVAMILPIALGISGARKVATRPAPETQSIRDALHEACRHRGYLLLLLGFYVCGFQVNFIGSHLPAHIVDAGVAARWGAIALMLVAFFNMIGSWGCGWIGDRYRKKYALSILYTFRTLLIVGFMVLPVTPWTIVIFSAGVGLTWLGTLPLVSGIIVDVSAFAMWRCCSAWFTSAINWAPSPAFGSVGISSTQRAFTMRSG
ncbi:MAG: MFS transporter [Pseudomonadota bacterium]|nr:MFS transporter [Pseudomonadota bacterium]